MRNAMMANRDSTNPKYNFHITLIVGIVIASLVLAACSPEPAPNATPELPMPTLVLPTATTAPATPTQLPPTPTPECPGPTEGTQLLKNEALGYCTLYSEGYIEVEIPPSEVCLVPGEPYMACHSANAFINVEEAAGRTADQIADEIVADAEKEIPGILIERTDLTVSGEQAVLLEGLPGVASSRNIYIVHADRLYVLVFVPWDETGEEFARIETLYTTVINSFTFLSITPPPALTEPSGVSGGTALVAFVEDGDILVWEEASGQSQTIFDSGDVIRVELSDDGQLVAFLRRSYFAADGFDRHEQSELWVVEIDGENPRQLVSAEQLRDLLNAAETDSTNIPQFGWIPGTHRLVYSGWRYFVVAEGESHATPEGVYSVDADTLVHTVLAPVGNSLHFLPSPDGGQIALISTTDVRVMNADGSNPHQAMLNYPATGVPMRIIPDGVWTQDASALLVVAPAESETSFE
jgi:hypothetical protein